MTRPKAGGTGLRFKIQRAFRQSIEVAKSAEKNRTEAIVAQKAELKRKREDKEKRRAENELKSSSYQVVRLPSV